MNVDLARWQFGFVTVNHFFFVPVTIGLAFLTAVLQTAWYRRKREEYLRLTRFLGPAAALRHLHRDHPGPDLLAARRDVPVPEDHRRHARALRAPGSPHSPLHRRRRRG